MTIDKDYCLIFINRIIPPTGATTPEKLSSILKFKEDKWEAIDIVKSQEISQYYDSDQISPSIVRIKGYSYCYIEDKAFWKNFNDKMGEVTDEEAQSFFWFFDKIKASIKTLNDKRDTAIKTLLLFIHWGGPEFQKKDEKIQQYYEKYKLQQEKDSSIRFEFTTFSLNKASDNSISWHIYNEKDPAQLLKTIIKGFNLSEGQFNRKAYDKFVGFEKNQVLEHETFLDDDENVPRDIQFIFGKKLQSEPTSNTKESEEQNDNQSKESETKNISGIDKDDPNFIFQGE